MNEWKLKVDNDVMIEVQKQDVIAQDYIKGKIDFEYIFQSSCLN